MDTIAVLLKAPEDLVLSRLTLTPPGDDDIVVAVEWSGISTGTERLLWSGRMPHFPGMGYPLVPGYESVGRVVSAGSQAIRRPGERVFVAGARCFGDVRGLFGGAAARLVVPDKRAVLLDEATGSEGVLLALAATAWHAMAAPNAALPDLIVGHGVLGRLLARIAVLKGGAPVVWERDAARRDGARGYEVIDPDADARRDYRSIYDVSGDSGIIDLLVQRMAPGGEIVLAGFYSDRIGFSFPPAFMREARIRIAAEWQEADLRATRDVIANGDLRLDGLVTHQEAAERAPQAYAQAFTDPACLKMVLDWRDCA
ncbi:chlorophyll synthesis pathway protein BchC [Roseomonas fluvialis]|uniref:Chlorophyll synthesis pathway protein BchC n=1 Tax=Roseomonas fluvialis TaxID=1750527 RepID=A0ABN6P2T7_9PROT|nr:chlorophyll synthesis pathway protein BchC [Roseomonas fluvialis]BDG72293.1 chlorophyll synthesis pathway protein BchC [Roseomonas fluvialis]